MGGPGGAGRGGILQRAGLQAARDYARRFGLPVPSESDLPADGGFARFEAARAEWAAREADPRTARKREADRRRREARAAWMEEHAAPILRAAGLDPSRRWDREDVKQALAGIPATEAGADMLRERMAERRARFEREEAEAAERERQRQEDAARARQEEEARATAAGYTLDEWRAMWRALPDAEYFNRHAEDMKAGPADRAMWRAGERPPYRTADNGWNRCEHGGDMLRIKPGNPDTLESSRGAEVPVSHARRVWRHVLRIMCAGDSWSGSIRCGHFTVSHVSPSGWMTAGCHRFNRAEMLRVAAILGEPVTCEDVAGMPAETLETESA